MKGSLRDVLRDAWRLASPYYRSEERWTARLMLASIIIMNFALVGMTVVLNYWNGAFFDSLQNKNWDAFINLLLFWRAPSAESGFMPGFVPIVLVYIPIAIYRTWLTQWLQIRWRRWMTTQYLGEWLSDRAYYTIGLNQVSNNGGDANQGADPGATPATDNPDQRISEDLRAFTMDTLDLGISLLRTVVSLFSFAGILWSLSGAITLFGLHIPGYLLWVAILYAILGTALTHYVGRPLARIEFQKQKLEANFRFSLVRVRENAEGIALYAGERSERLGLLDRFAGIVGNWHQYMNRTKLLNALIAGYEQVAGIFPFIVASPRYFAGEIMLGGLTRIAGAFARVQDALSWFVTAYSQLAVWRATVERLTSFEHAVSTAHALAGGGVRVREGDPDGITLQDVTLSLPDGRALIEHTGLKVPAGRSTVISGRSGSGKSTLFRAIAGIWPFGEGSVERPPGTMLFLPQRPYIPLGTLRQAIAYPADPASVDANAVQQALADAGLGALAGELDTEQPWAQRLSGGEQQRLAIARALLQRPKWLFLDEATASLDPEAEAELYAMLRERMPGTTILSIAHRKEVAAWHDDGLVMRGGELRAA